MDPLERYQVSSSARNIAPPFTLMLSLFLAPHTQSMVSKGLPRADCRLTLILHAPWLSPARQTLASASQGAATSTGQGFVLQADIGVGGARENFQRRQMPNSLW